MRLQIHLSELHATEIVAAAKRHGAPMATWARMILLEAAREAAPKPPRAKLEDTDLTIKYDRERKAKLRQEKAIIAARREHSSSLPSPPDEEWTIWTGANGPQGADQFTNGVLSTCNAGYTVYYRKRGATAWSAMTVEQARQRANKGE